MKRSYNPMGLSQYSVRMAMHRSPAGRTGTLGAAVKARQDARSALAVEVFRATVENRALRGDRQSIAWWSVIDWGVRLRRRRVTGSAEVRVG